MSSRSVWRIALLFVATAFLAAAYAADKAPKKAAKEVRILLGVGHFNREGKAFHYWDKEKEIPAVCARCHSLNGVAQYLKEGKTSPAPQVKNAFTCTTCHADMGTFERHRAEKVTFASGLAIDSGNNDSNLCMTCHQGRESTASVNKAIAGMTPDTPNPKLGFVHVHYFPAGAMKYGSEAKVGYEYDGKSYAGRFSHVPALDSCTSCHDPHTGGLQEEKCGQCHRDRRGGEAKAHTVDDYKQDLYAAIQQYARNVGGTSIAFSPEAYPYWYADTNGSGKIDPEELKPDNAYKAYTPRLMQAVYNYTFALRDPGAGYHNARYATQLLYDSLESLAQSGKAGVSMRGKERP
jgi:hypothetical protein